MAEPSPRRLGTRGRVARAAYLGVVLAALVWLGWDQRQEVGALASDTRPALLVLALVVTGVQLWLTAAFWAATLRALGEPLPTAVVVDASARSLLARYLPGSVWYAVGRSALLRHRVSGRALGVVAVLEIGLSVVVGFVLGAALLLATRRVAPAVGALGLAGVLAAAASCSPPVVNRALAWVARRRGGTPARLAWAPFLGLLGWMALFWVASSTSFAVYLHAFPGAFPGTFPSAGPPPVLEVAGAYMVARVLGMLAVFAPQGLGVFEVAVAALLTAAAGSQPALGSLVLVVAGYRALVLVRDGLAVVLAEALHSRRAPAPG